jgi:uncharacterized membrane protein
MEAAPWTPEQAGGSVSERIRPFAEWCATGIEAAGIIVIVIVAAYTLLYGVYRMLKDRGDAIGACQDVRQRLGRGILLGLEFLVAGDIIHTVAVELTFKSAGVLAIVVAIRTFLSFTLEVELTGAWPWRRGRQAEARQGGG